METSAVNFNFVWLTNSIREKPPEWIAAAAAVVSVLGVFLVWRQLSLAKKLAQLTFEDDFEKQYRDLVKEIPVKALLDSDLEESEYQKTFDDFFRYFDLSNTQVRLRQQKRISNKAWDSWCVGMRFNLSLPAFERAWAEVKMRTDEQSNQFFSELRKLEADRFLSDPKHWK